MRQVRRCSSHLFRFTSCTLSLGNLYIADVGNHRIRKVTVLTGVITTIVGTGTAGFGGDGSAATSAKLFWPSGLTFDSAGISSFSRYFSTVSRLPSP